MSGGGLVAIARMHLRRNNGLESVDEILNRDADQIGIEVCHALRCDRGGMAGQTSG